MPGTVAERRERAAHHPWLPRHLNNGVPVAVAHRIVGRWLPAIHGHQDRAVGNRSALPPGQTGHRMAVVYRLSRHLTPPASQYHRAREAP